MKRSQNKRSGPGSLRGKDLIKPFGFCCDVKSQDQETRYDRRDPPFKSSMANIFLNGGGPDLKFRIQDVRRTPRPMRKEGRRTTKGDSLGDCNRCRGPLKWYLEEEISLAKDMLADDKQAKYNSDMEKAVNIGIKKAKKRRERRREEKRKKQ